MSGKGARVAQTYFDNLNIHRSSGKSSVALVNLVYDASTALIVTPVACGSNNLRHFPRFIISNCYFALHTHDIILSTHTMEAPVVKFKKRGAKAAPRKAAPPPPQSDSDFSSGSEAEGEDGRVVKRRKTNGNALKASTADQKMGSGIEGTTKYEADRSAVIEASNDATKQSNWYDENADGTLNSKSLLGTTRTKPQTIIEKSADAPPRQVGPQKSSSNVRTITITDYTPDVCKDYKQTGFCGFGDNCKYLHAREDYAAGWKLDREWEMSTKGKKLEGTVVASANRDEKDKDDDGIDLAMLEKIPFACLICKKPYKTPIITKCGHYFCEACALKRYRKDPTCAACNAKTQGVFNGAKNLQKLLDKKQRWEDKKKAEAEAAEKEAAGGE